MDRFKSSFKMRSKRAFTLIEILVATVIMVILVGLVIQITSQVLNVWTKSSGRLSAIAQARIAMDIITQDLETAVFRNNNLQWLRSENDQISTLGDTTDTVALRLFSPALDRPDGPGDICAIAYQLKYANPVTGSEAVGSPDDRLFVLYRLVVDPRTTFNELMGSSAPDGQATLPNRTQDNWGASSIAGTQGDNYLVSNIARFEVEFHVLDDGNVNTPTLVTAERGTIYGGTDATVGPQSDQGDVFRQPLAYAEVRLTVLSDEGAAILQNLGATGEQFADVILEHGQVFSRRVYFPARPL